VLDESEELLGGVCDETEIIHEQNNGHEDEVLGGGQRDHQEITLVYICRIRMRLYVIKSLNDIYMSNNL